MKQTFSVFEYCLTICALLQDHDDFKVVLSLTAMLFLRFAMKPPHHKVSSHHRLSFLPQSQASQFDILLAVKRALQQCCLTVFWILTLFVDVPLPPTAGATCESNTFSSTSTAKESFVTCDFGRGPLTPVQICGSTLCGSCVYLVVCQG